MSEKRHTTIKDIANELGVSASTVSRALNENSEISKKTIKLVKETAERLNYQPNEIARNLRKKHSKTIGVIVPELVHHFFSAVISGIESIAYQNGYQVIICQSNESEEKEKKSVEALLGSHVAGIIASISKNTTDFEHFKLIQKRNIPLVFYDRICYEVKAPSIVCQDYEGGVLAAEHFIKHGKKNIAHLTGPENLIISKQRKNGFLDTLKKHHMHIRPELIVKADNFQEGIAKTNELLNLETPPDAIFTINDQTAAGAIHAIHNSSFKVPEDISVIGFEDDPGVTQLTEPPLSSVYQPSFEMGVEATKLFIEELETPSDFKRPKIKVLKTSLSLRGTTLGSENEKS
ncbi:LacI family DNA-binding transcriptional regulator [Aureibacter tunicatorum]|uniref:LacI family transcriptional regulator n=1 Tax=Aureibacter tunicatorum TaxID=866807 RepID=A0AAE4BSB8_9BACT|nr:LacI family DNA-binding transcriptional regulator [Aureibacter tunicatorum]MDR6238705.1 LacI family transcriptional regulator [Aureibacter tunicatorum]BDD05364.1 LacI family transcriptional regulator [Aureibacter tunicatorum]